MIDENGWPVFSDTVPKPDVPKPTFETPVTDTVIDTVVKAGISGAVGELIGLHL